MTGKTQEDLVLLIYGYNSILPASARLPTPGSPAYLTASEARSGAGLVNGGKKRRLFQKRLFE